MTHTHKLIEAKISIRARKEKNKEKREIITLLVLDSCSFVSCSLLLSGGKLYYNICLHLRTKLTIKRILSFTVKKVHLLLVKR